MSNICNNVYNTVLLHVDSSGLSCSTVIVAGATGGWKKKVMRLSALSFVCQMSVPLVLWVSFSSNFPFFLPCLSVTCRKHAAAHRMEMN
jgi:hypothetical protein